jgi:hypothetical protein
MPKKIIFIRGQATAEYALLLALIAAIMAVIFYFVSRIDITALSITPSHINGNATEQTTPELPHPRQPLIEKEWIVDIYYDLLKFLKDDPLLKLIVAVVSPIAVILLILGSLTNGGKNGQKAGKATYHRHTQKRS